MTEKKFKIRIRVTREVTKDHDITMTESEWESYCNGGFDFEELVRRIDGSEWKWISETTLKESAGEWLNTAEVIEQVPPRKSEGS